MPQDLNPSLRKPLPSALRRSLPLLALLVGLFVLIWLAPPVQGFPTLAAYLPLHTSLEFLSLVVAALVFAVGWHTWTPDKPISFLILPLAFLGVGLLDLGHTLSYAGMPAFVTSSSMGKAILFWLPARLAAALGLLAVALFPTRRPDWAARLYPRRHGLLLASLIPVALCFWLILYQESDLPVTYVQGMGLTATKVLSEYVLIIIYGLAAFLFWRQASHDRRVTAVSLFMAAATMVLSELCVTLYSSAEDIFNVMGHVYKVIAYGFLYRAVFLTTIKEPYDALRSAQDSLWQEKELGRITLLSIGDGLIATDEGGRVRMMNPLAETMTGWPLAEALGHPIAEVFLIRNAQTGRPVEIPVERVMREGTVVGLANHTVLQSRHGVSYHIADSAAPIVDLAGRLRGVVMVFQDVTREYQTRAALSAAQALNQGVLRSAAYGLIATDPHGLITLFNREAERLLGYTAEEVVGKQSPAIFHDPEELTRRAAELQQESGETVVQGFDVFVMETRLRQGGVAEREWLYRRRDGSPLSVSLAITELKDDDGGILGYLAIVQDLTEHKRTLLHLRQREEEFRSLVENSPDAIARYDRDYRRLYVNPAFARQVGAEAARLVGVSPLEDVDDIGRVKAFEVNLRQVLATGVEYQGEIRWPTPTGGISHFQYRLVPERDARGEIVSVLAVGRDITPIRQIQQRLEEAETLARVGHWEWDIRSGKLTVSAEMCRILGHATGWSPSLDELWQDLVAEDRDALQSAIRLATQRGDKEVIQSTRLLRPGAKIEAPGESGVHLHNKIRIDYAATQAATQAGAPEPVRLGDAREPLRVSGTCQDISEIKHFEHLVHDLSFLDKLTGLPNRTLFNDRLRQAAAEAAWHRDYLGLMIVNLDRFKEINETYGHQVGDRVLAQAGERLRALMREYDTVARTGGDEFAMILPNLRNPSDLGTVARKIFDTFAAPLRTELSTDLYLSASIGIAIFPTDTRNVEELLQFADSALYDAKARGRGIVQFYSSDLTTRSRERLTLEMGLRQALRNGELYLLYQPKVDLAQGAAVGVEALLRWNHPIQGNVPPDRFIGIAEDTGLIVPIGEFVLRSAFLQAREWNDARQTNPYGAGAFKVAVNLSTRQFASGDLVRTIDGILADTGCNPAWIELEITESLLLDNNEAIRATLEAFTTRGFTIAMDDFGTGYSALGYLSRFPIHTLKIDKSFVKDVTRNPRNAELVKAILSMARSLGLQVVAEGVEMREEGEFLRGHGCELAQGFLYGKPQASTTITPGQELPLSPLNPSPNPSLSGVH